MYYQQEFTSLDTDCHSLPVINAEQTPEGYNPRKGNLDIIYIINKGIKKLDPRLRGDDTKY